MIETKIWLALKSRIDTLSHGYPLAWPSEKFTLTGADPYIRVAHLPATPLDDAVTSKTTGNRTGVLVLTLVYPLGQKPAVYIDLAAQIASHFRKGQDMTYKGTCVKVTDWPHVAGGFEDSGFWCIPVRISWRAYVL